ncbi:TauD/TfdA family dioxygenase [Streptomyces sp. RS10V-4]|uniref:TauD/TfdA family dioxygenase n=1 Tax=Streptomyces rhizoryzae TaxID=2932493 RepID=UPI002006BC69|nr:TauD/TfdA family dioxygenase [Streptomyces rhizoryzae]MCK7623753.1 TauD/TfdA family dioxygenase [Streptomyces rhizoryzae]
MKHSFEAIADKLGAEGYAVVAGPLTSGEVTAVLAELGDLVPQTTGELAYDIRAHAGFAHVRDTRSPHALRPHTEAPGQDVPPRYLALHCRVQATCGGGQTLLADAPRFLATLDEDLHRLAHSHPVHWPSYQEHPGATGVRKPVVDRTAAGTVIRMSSTLLATGAYSEALDEPGGAAPPLGPGGLALARRTVDFMGTHGTSVLLPEDALLIWDNHRMFHARTGFSDTRRRLTRYWIADRTGTGPRTGRAHPPQD